MNPLLQEPQEVDLPPDIQMKINMSLNQNERDNYILSDDCISAPLDLHDDLFPVSSSTDSLNLLLERQRQKQLNHPLHQNLINAPVGFPNRKVKETNKVSLEYDPISKRKVLNTYEIIKELGHGQHGKVKLAKDLITGTLVAVKIVDRHEKKANRWRLKKSTGNLKLKREIAIMKKCHHDHVVKLIEVLDDSKSRKIYLVLEYCSRGEIKWCPNNVLETEARGPSLLTFQRTREIFRGVLLGLEYLHYQGIIHRDIKPANLLVSENDIVKISDFGVSLAVTTSEYGTDSVDELELAKTAGTPAFFAPEICLGNEAKKIFHLKNTDPVISSMIDIWALGVTLYCLLFGMLPFISHFELELFDKIVNQQLNFLSWEEISNNGVSNIECEEEYDCAKDLISRLLEKNPQKRITILQIKHHPFVCWDFDHFNGHNNEYISSKLTEKANFHQNQGENYQQISVSVRELDNAVSGINQRMKKYSTEEISLRKALFQKGDASIKPDSTKNNFNNINDINDKTNNDLMNDHIEGSQSRDKISPANNLVKDDNGCSSPFIDYQLSPREIFQIELQKFDSKRDPSSIVSLPVNSSFASLDSAYIDNYALYHQPYVNSDPQLSSSPTDLIKVPGNFKSIRGGNPKNFRQGNPHCPQQSSTLTNDSRSLTSLINHDGLREVSSYGLSLGGLTSSKSDRLSKTRLLSPMLGFHGAKSTNEFPVGSRPTRFKITSTFDTPLSTEKSDINTHPTNSSVKNKSSLLPPFHSIDKAVNIKNIINHSVIKKGNFFSKLKKKDRDSQYMLSSTESEYTTDSSNHDEYDSDVESLPFEFGIDSENGSVISLRNLNDLDCPDGCCDSNSDKDYLGDNEHKHSTSDLNSTNILNNHLFEPSSSYKPLAIHQISGVSEETNVSIKNKPTLESHNKFYCVPDQSISIYHQNTMDNTNVPKEIVDVTSTHTKYNPESLGKRFGNFPKTSSSTTAQESDVDQVLNIKLGDDPHVTSKDMLEGVLSSMKSGKRNSIPHIQSLKPSPQHKDHVSYINHYSPRNETKCKDQMKKDSLKTMEGGNRKNKFRSNSISIGLLIGATKSLLS